MGEGSAPPAPPRPVFCIVDPSLRDFVGHHFAWDRAVSGAAAAEGFAPVTLGHRAALPAVTGVLRVVPAFRRDIWARHPLARGIPGLPGRLLDHALCIRDFAADLRRGLDGLVLPPGSVVLGHMITAKHLPGFARVLARLPHGVAAVLLLRYQPFFYDNPIAARALRRLEALAAGGRRIRLASDSARLAQAIGRLTTLPVEVLPIPHAPPPAPPPAARPPGAPVRFASLGNARDEKGYLEILEAIRLLAAGPEGLRGLAFTLQSNDPQPALRPAVSALAAAPPPGVTLLRTALDEAAYRAALAEADIVLVPYWRSIYEARTSGVFLEALAAGKPVIATDDTWMSDELAALGGAGLLVPDRDPVALAGAIRRAAAEHDALAARARAARPRVLARHDARALVRQCAAAAAPPPGPPRRLAMFYPWDDLAEPRAGAARRCTLLLDWLAPRVEAVTVIQSGAVPTVVRRGPALTIEAVPRPAWSRPLRRAFRLAMLPLTGRAGSGQALFLWWHLERLADPRFRRRAEAAVRGADAVLLEYGFWAPVVLSACRRHGVPCVLTQHDVLAEQVTGSPLLRRWTKAVEVAALRRAARVVSVSADDQAAFRRLGVATVVAPNPVDPRSLAAPRMPPAEARCLLRATTGLDLPEARPVALFVGSAHAPNLAAVAALRRIAPACLPGLLLLTAGACAAPGLRGGVLSLGPVPEEALRALHALASLAVIPLAGGSGTSLKTLEAMAAGLPVLGTAAAFRGLAVRPGTDCVLEDALERWPDRIAALLADPAAARAMGEAARRAAARHAPDVAFAPYAALLGLPEAAESPPRAPLSRRSRTTSAARAGCP